MEPDHKSRTVTDVRAAKLFREKVGRELRRQFMSVVSEPLPDKWLDLLRVGDEGSGG